MPNCFLSRKYDVNQSPIIPLMPYFSRFANKVVVADSIKCFFPVKKYSQTHFSSVYDGIPGVSFSVRATGGLDGAIAPCRRKFWVSVGGNLAKFSMKAAFISHFRPSVGSSSPSIGRFLAPPGRHPWSDMFIKDVIVEYSLRQAASFFANMG